MYKYTEENLLQDVTKNVCTILLYNDPPTQKEKEK